MIQFGTTLRCNLPPRHIWVVLNDPNACDGQVLLVNLTTFRPNCADDVCILNHADFEPLDRPGTIAYSRHETGFAAGLQQAVDSGYFTEITSIPAATLQKIVEGGRQSSELPESAKRLLPPRK
jgi:hypothetical protein